MILLLLLHLGLPLEQLMVLPEVQDHEIDLVVIETETCHPRMINEDDHEVEADLECVILQGQRLARLQLLSESISIRRGKRRRKQSVKGNEDVRTPSTLDLVLAHDPHHLSEQVWQDDCQI